MKKVALSLLALALVGSMAFGQDAAAPAVKIGGYLDTGIKVYSAADSGTSSQVVGDDVGGDHASGGSYEFKLSYGTDKAGVNLRTRIEDLAASPYKIYARTAYAWFLIPNLDIVKVGAGLFGDDGFVGNGLDDEGDKLTNGNGLGVAITPAAGFTVGATVAQSSATTIVVPAYAAGASFTVPAAATVNAALLTGHDKDGKIAASGFNVTAKLLLDGPLSATAGINFYGLEQAKNVGTQIYDIVVGYKITDAFSAQLVAYVYGYGSDIKDVNGDDAKISYKINPSVSYVVDPVTTVGIGATYQDGASILGVYDGVKTINGFTPAKNTVAQKITLIEVKPNVTFTIDPSTKFLVFYAFDSLSGDYVKTDKTLSTLSLEARYSF